MRPNRRLLSGLIAIGAMVLAGCAGNRPPQIEEWDGLVLRPGTRLDAVFVKPDADIVGFRNVRLDPVQISFAANWDPNADRRSASRRLNAADLDAIKGRLAELFQQTFRAELARGGYALVEESGPDTLRVTPAIVDLFINAPADAAVGRSRTYTTQTGRMTLVLEMRDSVTGEVLARAVDRRAGRSTGQLQWTNRVTNTADAQEAIAIWASALRRALDELAAKAAS
jgi:hypothetical protein